jgi:hypothetical protein
MTRPAPRIFALLALVIAVTAAFAATAGAIVVPASGRYVYWADYNGRLMRVDAAGGTPEVVVASAGDSPNGVTIDRSNGRIYWAARYDNQIRSVAADGTDPQTLDPGAATVAEPVGVAIDPRRGRIYWANSGDPSLGWASLDGSGVGATVAIDPSLISGAQGIAIDPISDRAFWANTQAGAIASAGWVKLDGSGDAGPIGGSTPSVPVGMAFVPSLQRVYWAFYQGSGIAWAPAGGGPESMLPTPGVAPANGGGIGYDAVTDRLLISAYSNGEIQYAAADGSGGGTLTGSAGSPWGAPVATGAGALSSTNAPLSISTSPGTPKASTLKVQNTGNYPIVLLKSTSSSTAFDAGAGCPGVLAIDESCELTITYSPSGASGATGDITIATDAGSYSFAVTGTVETPAPTAAGILLSGVHAVKRCAPPKAAGTLSVGFTSHTATPLAVTLQRSSSRRRTPPTHCPARASQTGFSSHGIGKKSSKNFTAIAGRQAATLKQLFGTKSLAPGRYRMLFSYKGQSGDTVRKGTWFWVLAD